MTAARWMTGLPFAAAVTLALFILMFALIRQDMRLVPAREAPDISILSSIVEEPLRREPGARPTDLPEPPAPDLPQATRGAPPDHPLELPARGGVQGDGLASMGGAAMTPTLRVAPPYPERCAARGAAGEVLVQFDVTPEGAVTNVQILSSPDGCFDRPVIRAVSGWKYAPAYSSGRPVARRGVVEKFVFELRD